MGWPSVVGQYPEHALVALVLVLVVVVAALVAFGPRSPRVIQAPPPYRPPKARRATKRKHAAVLVGWALLVLTACEYLPPIVVPTPPPSPSPSSTPSPTPTPTATPEPLPSPTAPPSAPPTPEPSPTPCVPQVVQGEPGCTPCAEQIAYLERQGYFRPIGGIWYESDNCGSAMVSAKCELLNARPHLGFPACSVWRRTTDVSPKRAPEGDTCVPRTIACPSPSPGPSPSPSGGGSCTANGLGVVKVGVGSLGCNDNGKCHYHATVRFGTSGVSNGKPCDGAHPPCGQEQPGSQCEPCGGAICDPTTGAVWTASGGLQIFGTEENDYRVTTKGRGKLTACPAPNPVTASGVPLRVHGSACTTVDVP